MTIFIGQKELLKTIKKQLSLPEDVNLKINLNFGKTSVESLWLYENGNYDIDLKNKKGEK